MSQNESMAARLRRYAIQYGLPASVASVSAYEAYCQQNPNGLGCGSVASVKRYLKSQNKAHNGARRADVERAPSAAAYAPVSVASNFGIHHRIRCEGDKFLVSGMDLLAQIYTPAAIFAGTNLLFFRYGMDAPLLAGTRQVAYAQMWEKWRVRRVSFHYQPAVSTSTTGQVVFAWDNDPTDGTVVASDTGLKELFSYRSNRCCSVWTPASLSCALDESTKNLFTSSGVDSRLFSAGTLQMAAVAAVPPNTALGTVWMSYEIEFSSPSELRVGPSDAYAGAAHNVATASSNAQSIYEQIRSTVGSSVYNSPAIGTAANVTGFICQVLVGGTYIMRTNVALFTAGGSCTIATGSQYVSGTSDPPVFVAATYNKLTSNGVNQSIIGKWGVVIPPGATYLVWTGFINNGVAFTGAAFSVRLTDLVGVPTAAVVDAYP